MSLKTSVVIVSYNNWETTTGPCLKSLLADESNQNIEIIVVDNQSQDQTPEMLKTAALENDNVKILLNTENRGFAGGNNDGVKMAEGEIVVLLNSDTIVPPKSILALARRLSENEKWAMLGPITNQAGNEQKIYTQNSDVRGIIEEGQNWCLNSNGDSFESPRLDFCCVAIRKTVYNALGGLDEDFGLGYYEDTDFSLKALKMGYKMFFTESVFIYHKAGESFSSCGRKKVTKLMKANKKLLKRKYAGKFKLHHMRDCNLRILKEYLCLEAGDKNNRDYCKNLQYRFDRRLMFAQTMYPNSPIKKIKYAIPLWSVSRQFRKGEL